MNMKKVNKRDNSCKNKLISKSESIRNIKKLSNMSELNIIDQEYKTDIRSRGLKEVRINLESKYTAKTEEDLRFMYSKASNVTINGDFQFGLIWMQYPRWRSA